MADGLSVKAAHSSCTILSRSSHRYEVSFEYGDGRVTSLLVTADMQRIYPFSSSLPQVFHHGSPALGCLLCFFPAALVFQV
jgi:hypothetical protein